MPAMQETQVQLPGLKDPLEKEMATHSSFLAWRIPWTEKQSRLQSMGSQRVGPECATDFHFFFFFHFQMLEYISISLGSLLEIQIPGAHF